MKAEGVLAFCARSGPFFFSLRIRPRSFVRAVGAFRARLRQSVSHQHTPRREHMRPHDTTLYSLLSRTCARPTEGVTTRASLSARSARCGSKPIQSTV